MHAIIWMQMKLKQTDATVWYILPYHTKSSQYFDTTVLNILIQHYIQHMHLPTNMSSQIVQTDLTRNTWPAQKVEVSRCLLPWLQYQWCWFCSLVLLPCPDRRVSRGLRMTVTPDWFHGASLPGKWQSISCRGIRFFKDEKPNLKKFDWQKPSALSQPFTARAATRRRFLQRHTAAVMPITISHGYSHAF